MIEAARGPCDSAHVLNWDDFRYFLAIARAGTLAGAARDLTVEHTTVGRRLTALEQALGTRLFTRGPDGFIPTRAGREILPLAEEMAERAEGIVRRVSGDGVHHRSVCPRRSLVGRHADDLAATDPRIGDPGGTLNLAR